MHRLFGRRTLANIEDRRHLFTRLAHLTPQATASLMPYNTISMLLRLNDRLGEPLSRHTETEFRPELIEEISLREAKLRLARTIGLLCEEFDTATPNTKVDAEWMRWAYRLTDTRLRAFGV